VLPLDRPDSLGKTGPEIWVRRLKANEEINFYSASPKFWLLWVHWAGDHSEPCFKDHKKCPGHRNGLPRRKRAFLYGWNAKSKQMEFLELPPQAAADTEALFMGPETLRGKLLRFKRGAGPKSRITPHLVSLMSEDQLTKLPADKDPGPTIVKLWGIEDMPDGAAAKPTIPFAI